MDSPPASAGPLSIPQRKIIYISIGRLTDKLAYDWCIDYLISAGASVEYWDIVALYRDRHSERGEQSPNYLRVFGSFTEVEAMLSLPENRAALYVMLVNYTGRFTRIFRLLSRHNCRMVFIAWGAMPRSSTDVWHRLMRGLRRPLWTTRELYYWGKAVALRKSGLVRPFELVFAAGDVLVSGKQYANKVVPINLCDYDQYVNAKSGRGRLISDRYAVFLDINLPYHSDLALSGYPCIDAAIYYRSLARFFDLVEAKYGMHVVVAAHPRSDYDASTFRGRQIHRLSTAELVRHAELVLCHTTTALSYVVLNGKPVLFIYTEEMRRAYENTLVREMRSQAKYLGAAIVNIDGVSDGAQLTVAEVNANSYEHYKYEFLTTKDSENHSTRKILLRELSAAGRNELTCAHPDRASR